MSVASPDQPQHKRFRIGSEAEEGSLGATNNSSLGVLLHTPPSSPRGNVCLWSPGNSSSSSTANIYPNNSDYPTDIDYTNTNDTDDTEDDFLSVPGMACHGASSSSASSSASSSSASSSFVGSWQGGFASFSSSSSGGGCGGGSGGGSSSSSTSRLLRDSHLTRSLEAAGVDPRVVSYISRIKAASSIVDKGLGWIISKHAEQQTASNMLRDLLAQTAERSLSLQNHNQAQLQQLQQLQQEVQQYKQDNEQLQQQQQTHDQQLQEQQQQQQALLQRLQELEDQQQQQQQQHQQQQQLLQQQIDAQQQKHKQEVEDAVRNLEAKHKLELQKYKEAAHDLCNSWASVRSVASVPVQTTLDEDALHVTK